MLRWYPPMTPLFEPHHVQRLQYRCARVLTALLICVATQSALAEIVISELMVHPAGNPEPRGEEFVELHNSGTTAVDVSGWQLDRGVSFTIPAGTTIAANGYLVLASNREALLARSPTAVNVIEGEWSGKLSNSGERVRLSDSSGDTIDQVEYADEGDWAQRRQGPVLSGTRGWIWNAPHDGDGFSLELIDPLSRNDRGQNWGSSTEPGGTPGTANSIASENIAPFILKASHSPAVPSPTDSVTIRVRIEDRLTADPDVTVRYRVAELTSNEATSLPRRFQSAPMYDDGRHNDYSGGDGTFAAILPPQPDGAVIEFYIDASDGELSRTWPAPSSDDGEQRANALYRVQSEGENGSLHDAILLVMTPNDDRTFSNISRSSNALMNTSIVWQQENGATEIRYQCGVRVRGNSSRRSNPHPIRLTVPEDQPMDSRTEFNINSNHSYLQVLGMHLFSQAGLPAPTAQPVQLFYNGDNRARRTSPMFGHYALLEPLGDEFLDREIPDSAGNLYKKRSANPSRDRKRWGVHFESTVVYDRENWYRTDRWEKQTNVTEDDWSDLQRFVEVMHAEPDETFLAEADTVINRQQWLRWFALMTLLNNRETNLSNGIDDDYSMYRGIEDPRFVLLPHDFDSILNQGAGASESIFPMIERVSGVSGADEIPQLIRYMRSPEIEREYFAQLADLLDSVLATERFRSTTQQLLGNWVSEGTILSIRNALEARRTFVQDSIFPKTVTVDWNGTEEGEYSTIDARTTALSGDLDSTVHSRITVGGVDAELDLANDRWSIESVSLFPGINRIPVVGFGFDGAETDSTFIDIWRTDVSPTTLTPLIDSDRTLTAAAGPYLVSGVATVEPGVTLTIAPGASLFFEPEARLQIRGILKAEGTENRRIRFTSTPGADPVPDIRPELPMTQPHWAGIWFNLTLSSENVIRFADIEYAQHSEGSIYLDRSEAVVDACTFRGSRLRYIYSVASSATVSGCTFPDMFLPGEEPHALRLDNVSEHIKGTGAFPSGGHFVIRENTFGTNAGHNDVIDVDSGRRSDDSRKILQVLNNVFAGGRDEQLDLGGDVYVDGNFFTNIHKDDQTSDRGYANSISSGDTATDTTIVVTRNVFWDVDHAINLKRNAATVFENNTVVDVHDDFVDTFGFTNIGSAINLYVDEPGATSARGAYAASNLFYNVPRVFGNADLPGETISILAADSNVLDPAAATATIAERNSSVLELGTGNKVVTATPFVDAENGDFRLLPDTAARGAGTVGQDAGAYISPGIFVLGEPDSVTDSSSASLTVGGPGIFSFQYRINDGEWSDESAIGETIGFDRDHPGNRTAEITLTDLAEGRYQIAVRGRNYAGEWQEEPTLSREWEVRPLLFNERIRLNEILASNRSSTEIAGSFPDLIELKNLSASPVDISGVGLSDELDTPAKYLFPAGTSIPANGYLLISAGTEIQDNAIPATDFGLSASGDSLYLFASDGALIDSIAFGFQAPDWSISRFYDEWRISLPSLASANTRTPTDRSGTLVINEFLAASANRFEEDYIELYNSSLYPVLLDGLQLTDDAAYAPAKFTFPPLSFLAPAGFLSMDQSTLGFSIARDSEEVALIDHQGFAIDSISIANAGSDEAYGRAPDGSPDIQTLTIASPGQPNIPPSAAFLDLLAGLRVTEILFSPAGDSAHEFIELQNTGNTQLNLEGIRFTDGISFTFGAEILEPGEFIVVTQDLPSFTSRYGVGVRVAGTYSGRLDNSGESLELSLPSPATMPIQRFRYEADWFTQTAGGRSIEFVDDLKGQTALWNERTSWLPSTNPLGSPGKAGAPIVTNIAATTIIEEDFNLEVIARNDVTSYSSAGLPAGLTLDRTTGIISGQASESGNFDVTISANSPEGQRSGKISLYVSAYGPFQEIAWTSLENSYSLSGGPIPFSLQAVDDAGRTVESFAEQINISATQLKTPQALVLVTELINNADVSAIELANVSGRPLPASDWKIVTNDSAAGVTGVHPALPQLPAILESEMIIVIDEMIELEPDLGWVMIVDGSGTVLDFLPWGYPEDSLTGLRLTVEGVEYEPGLLWKSAGLEPDQNEAWHRTGNTQLFDDSQWRANEPSLGVVDQDLVVPFADVAPLSFSFTGSVSLLEGAWIESFTPDSPLYGVKLTASFQEMSPASQPFSVIADTPPPPPVLPEVSAVEGQAFRFTRRLAINDSALTFAAENLPSGLVLDPTTGSISGTAPDAGDYAFNLSAINLAGASTVAAQFKVLSDADGDGAPDEWELSNGLNPQVADAEIDIDADGASNLNEYLAGTDPRDSSSVFRIVSIGLGTPDDQLEIEWRSISGRRYAIESSANLEEWEVVSDSEITADAATTRLQFPKPSTSRTYRIRLLP